MTEIYLGAQDFENAFKAYKKSIEIRDSLINVETQKNIKEIEARYKSEKKDAQHRAQVKEFKLQREKDEIEQKRKDNFIFGMFVVVVLVLVLLFVVFRSNRLKQRTNKILYEQKTEIEHKNELLSEKNRDITDSITYAKRLQDAILPPAKMWKAFFPESFIFYRPKDIVAGDFYWLESTADNEITFFAAADCTGHGVPGAMVSVICSNALNRAVNESGITDPGKILDKVRELVTITFSRSESEVRDGMDISIGAIHHKDMELHWAGANNPLWIFSGNDFLELKPDKQPVGQFESQHAFTTYKTKINNNDCLYLFTDGYQDQFGGPDGKKFKAINLKKLLHDIREKPMKEQEIILEKKLVEWRNTYEQIDDICVIGIKIVA